MPHRGALLRAAATAGAAAAMITLAACSPGSSNKSDNGGSGAAVSSANPSTDFKGKTLTYVYFTDGPDLDATKSAIAEFEKQTGAKVNLQTVPFDNLTQTLQARLSGNNVPEVARTNDWHPFADQAIDFKATFGDDYAKEFVPGLVTASSDTNGHMYAAPSDLTMNGPFVNVDAFQKAGVPVPTKWTWDELVADAKKVQAANHMQFAFVLDESGHRMSTVLSQFGTTMIGEDGKKALDEDKATKALTLLTGLVKDGSMSKDFWLESGSKYKAGNDMFLAQAVPVYLSGNWQVAAFAKDAKFRWAVVPNPCEERCGGFPGGKYMVAFKNSKNPQLGAYFVKFMNSKQTQAAMDPVAGWMPTRNDLVSGGVEYPADTKPALETFLADVKNTPNDTYATEASPAFTASATALVDESQKVVAGQEDVTTAVKNLSKAIDDAVAESGS